MNTFTMPAPVTPGRANVAPSAKRRTGLVPMQPGSAHMLTIGGAPVSVTARDRESVPHGTAAVHICLHPRCAGKSWSTFAHMQADHPQASHMARTDEVHVYGLWSDDPQDEEKRMEAEEKEQEAKAALAEAEQGLKDSKTPGDKMFWRQEKATKFAEHLEAQKALAAASGCVGLIAPADPSRAVEE